jgi:hypothetical protein
LKCLGQKVWDTGVQLFQSLDLPRAFACMQGCNLDNNVVQFPQGHDKACMYPSGWPDWANFRLLGDCFRWEVFKNTKIAHIFCSFLQWKKMYTLILRKIGLDHILGDFLTNSSGHPGTHVCM